MSITAFAQRALSAPFFVVKTKDGYVTVSGHTSRVQQALHLQQEAALAIAKARNGTPVDLLTERDTLSKIVNLY